jgi:hypothetical protein
VTNDMSGKKPFFPDIWPGPRGGVFWGSRRAFSHRETLAARLTAPRRRPRLRSANENQCIINGYQAGTNAFDQCVKTAAEQQLKPHRPDYFRSLD